MKTITDTYFVEDNNIFTIVFQNIFASCQGMFDNLNIFPNGKMAHQALLSSEKLPDLILLDINMPIMNGWEFLEKLRGTEFENIPVYILTSSINPEDKQKSDSYKQVKGNIVKPLSKDQLEKIHSELTA